MEIKTFFSPIFLLNPLLGIIWAYDLLLSKNSLDKKKLLSTFVLMLSLWLAFINSTKVPDNDLIHHTNWFLNSEGKGFLEYLTSIYKEPLFYAYNYIFFYLSGGNVALWIITHSFFSYFLFFTAIKKFFLKLNLPLYFLVFGLICAAFFPQLFSLSAHLMRQFLANAIFILFAVEKIFYKKNKWWLALAAVLSHASSLLLVALVYYSPLRQFKKNRVLNIILLIALYSYQFIATFLLNTIGNLNVVVRYILERASADTFFDLGSFPLFNYIMMFGLIVGAITGIKVLKNRYGILEKKNGNTNPNDNEELFQEEAIVKDVNFFFLIMIVFSVFILTNINQSELSIRLFFYLFFYLPFISPLFLARFKDSKSLSLTLSLILIAYFIYRLGNGVWEYAPPMDLLFNSSLHYIFADDVIH
jgi:hypothetical protein